MHFFLIDQWINTLIPKNLVELDLDIVLNCDFNDIDEFCLKLLPCESLEILKLSLFFDLEMPMSSGSFNNLRVFHLSYNETDLYRELVENIFPSLPRLEELSIKANIWEPDEEKRRFNITAPALKSLVMSIEFQEMDYTEVEIVIDAPCLEYFCLEDERMSSYPVLNVPSLSEAKITVWNNMLADICLFDDVHVHTVTNYINALRLLRGVSNAKHLSLSTGQSLASWFAHQDNLAKFPVLTKFELFVPHNCGWNLVLNLLACAPNLEILIIFKKGFGHADLPGEFLTPKSIPTCLLLHLKEVKIKGLKEREYAKFVVYLIENAEYLKDLTVNSAKFMEDGELIQELFAKLIFLYT